MKGFKKDNPQDVMIVTRMFCVIVGSCGITMLTLSLIEGRRGLVCAAASVIIWIAFWFGVWSRGLGYDDPK